MKFPGLKTKGVVSSLLFYVLILTFNQAAFSQYVCQINGGVVNATGAIGTAGPTQNARINRDGVPSSCTGGAPTAAPVAGTFNYSSQTFTNPHSVEVCVVVDYNFLTCGGNSTQVNAYSTFNPASPNTNVIGKPGFSTTGFASLQFRVAANASFTLVFHETATNTGCPSFSYNLTYRVGCRQPGFDFTNDGKADLAYYRPSSGAWNILNSSGGANSLIFGLAGDTPTAGDYTGDGRTNVSTYRSAANTWFYSPSYTAPQSNVNYIPWGVAGDVPVPGDYDKDGKTDVAVWRPSDGFWYILRSSNNTVQYQKWGASGDTPVTGDYDGDLITDFVVVRSVGGTYRWFLLNSNFGFGFVYGCGTTTPICGGSVPWGTTGDRIVSGDFDGDARTDIAVFRPSTGTWQYLRSSATGQNVPGATAGTGFAWGTAGDIPQAADYDGDKRTDFAIFRPSTATWFVSNSNNGTYNTFTEQVWGAAGDQPVSSPYLVSNP